MPRWLRPGPAALRPADPAHQRLLLIRPDHLGDVLFATPALQVLRQARPTASITLMVGPWAREIVARNPHIDEVLTCPFPWFTREPKGWPWAPYGLLWRTARELRAKGFHSALNLRYDFWWGALLAYAAGIPERVGYALPECLPFLTQSVPYQVGRHEVVQNLGIVAAALGREGAEERLLGPLEFVLAPEDEAFAARWVATFGERRPLVALHPGAGAPVKRWRTEAFAYVADRLRHKHGVEIVVTGSPPERELVEGMAGAMQTRATTLTHATLGQLAAVLRRCRLVIGVDSGVLHLAVAVGTPTLHLFGPVDARTFGPWGEPTRHVVLSAGWPCSPCDRLDWQGAALARHGCTQAIAEEQVLAAAANLLEGAHAPRH